MHPATVRDPSRIFSYSVVSLWIRAKTRYKVGSYLETYLKIRTNFAKKFKNTKLSDKQFGIDLILRILALNRVKEIFFINNVHQKSVKP